MYKVMIVDDEPWVLERLREIADWEMLGFALAAEEDEAALAWEHLLLMEPDVVITDINMPVISGLELLERARNRGLETEFLIVSGYDDFRYAQKAIEIGVFHYFLKPLERGEFTSVLQRLKRRLDSRQPAHTGVGSSDGASCRTESPCLNSILDYLRDNYSQPVGLAEISGRFYVSQTYICDLFSKYLNTTFVKYLNGLRLDQAKRLLETTGLPVSQVALETGFRDYSYFSKLYKKKFGVSPSDSRGAGQGKRESQ
ncbi:MAG: helix-turn-helix domain-containing protein [Oscillospiraceae bacterium]